MNFKAMAAEFIGTFALIFMGVCAISQLGLAESNLGLTGIALAHGLALACLISATAAVSGGHLNPAVSFGLFVAKKIDAVTMVAYWIAQVLGGLAAAAVAQFVMLGGAVINVTNGTPAIGAGYTMPQALVAEIVGTFFLVFTVFGTAVDRRAPKMGGLFVGLSVTMGILAVGPISGAAFNPARYLGPALLTLKLQNVAVWTVGPFIGGLLAAMAYTLFMENRAAEA